MYIPHDSMPTFYDRFVECAGRWPDNVALEIQRHDRIESCTYAEIHRMAESVGRWITENGFARGSRLAIVADNHPRWVAAYLGIIAAGCTVVPLDTALHADQLAKLLKDSGSSAMFCDARHAQAAREAVASLNIGLVLMDPDRMAEHSIREHWLGNLPAIFDRNTTRRSPVLIVNLTPLNVFKSPDVDADLPAIRAEIEPLLPCTERQKGVPRYAVLIANVPGRQVQSSIYNNWAGRAD